MRRYCGLGSIADKVDAFIAKYPSYNFYDYYQIIQLRDIPYPFKLTKNIQIDSKAIGTRTIAIYATVVTDQLFTDYKEYANMNFIEAIYFSAKGAYESARNSYLTGRGLFDGKGFADKSYRALGYYETYKIALGLYVAKFLNYVSDIELFRDIINRINPYATLYNASFNGVGDLNAETAALTILALSNDPYRFSPQSPAISTPPSASEIALRGIATIIELLIAYTIIKSYLSAVERYRQFL